MNDKLITERLLSQAEHMVIGVVLSDSTPWVVPLHIKNRNGYHTFEWDSRPDTIHSLAIEKNPNVALSIFSIEKDLGFYAKATAVKVSDQLNENGQIRYSATVSECWLNESHRKRKIED